MTAKTMGMLLALKWIDFIRAIIREKPPIPAAFFAHHHIWINFLVINNYRLNAGQFIGYIGQEEQPLAESGDGQSFHKYKSQQDQTRGSTGAQGTRRRGYVHQ
jgi:hypothetical protein